MNPADIDVDEQQGEQALAADRRGTRRLSRLLIAGSLAAVSQTIRSLASTRRSLAPHQETRGAESSQASLSGYRLLLTAAIIVTMRVPASTYALRTHATQAPAAPSAGPSQDCVAGNSAAPGTPLTSRTAAPPQ